MDEKQIEDYKPEIVQENTDNLDGHRKAYALMLVELDECPICKKMMLYVPEHRYGRSTFPRWIELNAQKQLERAGWAFMSHDKQDDRYVCVECSKAGRVTFLCAFCKEIKPTSKIEISIGDPPEYLCTDCYETKPAKDWHDKWNELLEEHRYDYE